jgi:HTH-type transcriptional regulator/antitoxin HigA
MSKFDNHDFADSLINQLNPVNRLIDLFQKRIIELDILPTHALELMDIEYRPLQGILNGTSKRFDYANFRKVANFLQIPLERVLKLYFDELAKNFPEDTPYPQNKIDFINSNFDLATLRKNRFIKSITDYKEIEKKINNRFGFKSIFEYKPEKRGVFFSEGAVAPTNINNRLLWIEDAINIFKELSNPYEYDRHKLIDYIPSIRAQCLNIDNGLKYVISDLYKLGVTVIYQSAFSNLHLRGATIVINDKPCIALTNYRGFYPTLWFALLHEISHVLFDIDEIKNEGYHITDKGPNEIIFDKKEEHANKLARDYFLSLEKLDNVRPHLSNKAYVIEFSERNNVDKSFVYVFHAFYADKDDLKAWTRAQTNNPDFTTLTDQLDLKWDSEKSIEEHVKYLKEVKIYN